IDHVTIAPSVVNVGVKVNAGADATFGFPSDAILHGTVTDDAKPAPPGAFTTLWSLSSGPRPVTFANATAIDTTAAFTLPGLYTLRLTADDGAVKTFDSIVINASSATTVNITLSDSAASETGPGTGEFTFTRTGSTAGALTVNFTISGSASASDYAALPATVVIPDGQSQATLLVTPIDDALVEGNENVIIKLAPGIYNPGAAGEAVLTIVDSDVIPSVTITSPTAPIVNIPAGIGILLEASVIDDGLPNPLTFAWSKVSGPGTVVFGSGTAVNTTATFSVAGTYVLRLSASDGQFTGASQVTVNSGFVDYLFSGTKVGAQAIPPASTFAGGTYTLSAAGAGIPSSGTLDDFFFLNIPVTGDVTITARLVSVQNISGSNSRAGVMIRQSLAADAAEAFCGITSAGSGRGIFRDTAAATSANVQATAALPSWIRLIRIGTSFTVQFAPDRAGIPDAFTTAGTPQTLSMGETVFVGLAATSGSTGTAGTTVFDNITIVPGGPNIGATVNAGLDVTVMLPGSVTLDGTVSDDGKPSPLITAWTKESGPGNVTFGNAALVDTTAAFSANGSYMLRLIANDGAVKTFDDTFVSVQSSPIEQWRQTRFGSNAGNSAIAGDLANPDGDASNNLLEYALGLDPLRSDSGGIVADIETIGPDKFLRLTIAKNPAATDVVFHIEVTGELTSSLPWSAADTTVEVNIGTQLRVRDNISVDSAPQRNIRLKVTHP
ncbi:MAG: hypothetical protein V4710_05315, partial [Verrucomicrobiota bacterium]